MNTSNNYQHLYSKFKILALLKFGQDLPCSPRLILVLTYSAKIYLKLRREHYA